MFYIRVVQVAIKKTKMPIKIKFAPVVLVLASVFIFQYATAQEAVKPRLSPLEIVTLKYESTYIKVTYGRPHKKGRDIFGALVPFGEVWRTGANEATEITFTKDVKINGKRLNAGTYTVFTIPERDKWTVILNSDLGQWGSYNYNADRNVMEIEAEVSELDITYEPFTIEFQLQDDEAKLIMMWDKTKASFTIEFLD